MKGNKMKTLEQILTAEELATRKQFFNLINSVSPEWREEIFHDQLNDDIRNILNKIKIVRAMDVKGLHKYPNFKVKTSYYGLIDKIVLDNNHFIIFVNIEPAIWYQSDSGGSWPLELHNKAETSITDEA